VGERPLGVEALERDLDAQRAQAVGALELPQLEVLHLPGGSGWRAFPEAPGAREEEVAGAVGPRALERYQDAAVGGEPKTVLGDRRAQQVAAELFEPGAVFYRHRRAHGKIEALEIGPSRASGSDPWDRGRDRGRAG
jgi:hypothetical protein